jgi:hypothetical protein
MKKAETGIAIQVRYWMYERENLAGIDDFRKELSTNYISSVRGEPCYEKGGGLYSLLIDLVCQIKLQDLATAIISGIAYDSIKGFIIKPFLGALTTLLKKEQKVDIQKIQINFQDTKLILSPFSAKEFDKILRIVATNYSKLLLPCGEHYGSAGKLILKKEEYPSSIYIPIFHDYDIDDPTKAKGLIYRGLQDVDEFIRPDFPKDFYGYWGIEYSVYLQKIFDVQNQKLINESFMPAKYLFSAPGF